MYRLVAAPLILAFALSQPRQTPARLAPFTAIEVPRGGHIVLVPGTSHGINIVEGNRKCTTTSVTSGGVLVIDEDRHQCPNDYRLEMEVTAPSIKSIAFGNGGWVRVASGFPRQDELEISVSNGGTVDARSIPAVRVVASVEQGGRIFTIPGESLAARVRHGGVITYWGNPRVSRTTYDGGVIQRGSDRDRNLPVVERTAGYISHREHACKTAQGNRVAAC